MPSRRDRARHDPQWALEPVEQILEVQEDDWGYGPPSILATQRVQVAADALADLSYADLIAEVDHRDLVKAKVYPQGWDSPDSLEWARDWFENLKTFFHTAASQGDAMLIWID